MTGSDRITELHTRADRVRNENGWRRQSCKDGRRGDRTIRQHIEDFLDTDSFREIGTFSRSIRLEEREKNFPGTAKLAATAQLMGDR